MEMERCICSRNHISALSYRSINSYFASILLLLGKKLENMPSKMSGKRFVLKWHLKLWCLLNIQKAWGRLLAYLKSAVSCRDQNHPSASIVSGEVKLIPLAHNAPPLWQQTMWVLFLTYRLEHRYLLQADTMTSMFDISTDYSNS